MSAEPAPWKPCTTHHNPCACQEAAIWQIRHDLDKAKGKMDSWEPKVAYRLVSEAIDRLTEMGYDPEKDANADQDPA